MKPHTMASRSNIPLDDMQEPTSQQIKSSRQRFKPQLSCTLCRNRKLKCDRQLPCGNCSKRGISASCTFVHGNKSASVSKGASSKGDVHSQIQNLEELVLSIMNRANQTSPQNSSPDSHSIQTLSSAETEDLPGWIEPNSSLSRYTPSDVEPSPDSFNQKKAGGPEARYVGDIHWTAILENIAGLKDTLEAEQIQPEPQSSSDNRGPDLLLGGSFPRASRAEILSTLPPRGVVEAYVRDFLETVDMGADYIHRPTFEKEIERFYADPSKTSISWVGLLYIVICLSTHYALLSKTNNIQPIEEYSLLDQAESVDLYRMRAVQCLLSSNYTEPDHHTIPTLLLYYLEEHFRSPDASFGTWMVFSMIVRAAMRLGYHRDASNNPNISVYRAEMQRRHWSAIVYLDMQNSQQVGLPRMIREDIFDTKTPHNILDTDFHEHSTSLPPIQPSTEDIPINFSNCKHKLMAVSGRIMDQANSTKNLSYDEITALDQALSLEESLLPSSLRTKTLSDLYTGLPDCIFRRWQLGLIVHKSRIILHRRFMFPSKTSGTYAHPYSVKFCVDASMSILQAQLYMFQQTQPGKTFFGNRWKASSLMMHDFLLAAMILCLHVGQHSASAYSEIQRQELDIKWTRGEMVEVLEQLYEIYDGKKTISKEAAKAATTLGMMLQRVQRASSQSQSHSYAQFQARGPTYPSQAAYTAFSPLAPPPTTSQPPNPLGSWSSVVFPSSVSELSSSSSTFNTAAFDPIVHNPQDPNTTTQGMEQVGFNWELWDSHFLPNPQTATTPPDLWDFNFDFNLNFSSDARGNSASLGNIDNGMDMPYINAGNGNGNGNEGMQWE